MARQGRWARIARRDRRPSRARSPGSKSSRGGAVRQARDPQACASRCRARRRECRRLALLASCDGVSRIAFCTQLTLDRLKGVVKLNHSAFAFANADLSKLMGELADAKR